MNFAQDLSNLLCILSKIYLTKKPIYVINILNLDNFGLCYCRERNRQTKERGRIHRQEVCETATFLFVGLVRDWPSRKW